MLSGTMHPEEKATSEWASRGREQHRRGSPFSSSVMMCCGTECMHGQGRGCLFLVTIFEETSVAEGILEEKKGKTDIADNFMIGGTLMVGPGSNYVYGVPLYNLVLVGGSVN